MTSIGIRFYEPGDAPALHAAARESVSELHPWLPWCHPDYTIEEAREWIALQGCAREAGSEYAFVIAGADGAFLGGCGLNQLQPAHGLANLGYWVRSSAAGQGVAPAAVRSLARWAFANTDLCRLEIVAACENVRSQRVAEKAGAEREGVLRERIRLHGRSHDAVLYSIVRSRWPGV